MSPAALIRHHTGRMAGPARWYLAVLAMLSLGLLAAHFAVQEHVQKKMRLAVHGWLQDGGGSVQHVRYHLLRGALTLEQVRWVTTPDSGPEITVSQVSLRTSSQAMSSGAPYFSLIRFDKPVLSVRREQVLAWMRGGDDNQLSLFTGLLEHAEEVSLSDMQLRISGGEADAPRVGLIQQVEGYLSADGIELKGVLGSGQLLLKGNLDERGQLIGNIGLRGVAMDSLAVWFGGPSAGGVKASGNLELNGDWQKRDVGMQGLLQMKDALGAGTLALKGGWTVTGASMKMTCSNAPLNGLPLVWPSLAGRKLVAGRMNGEMHLEHKWNGAWHLAMDGDLTDVRLHAPDLPAWQMHSVSLTDAELFSGSGALKARAMRVLDADIAVNAFSQASATPAVLMPEVKELSLQRIRPRLHFADATELTLPELEGKGSLGRLGRVSLSTTRKEAGSPEGVPDETWKIKAEGNFLATWQAEVKARHVPIVRLRPLLPDLSLPGEKGVPDYSGSSDLSLQLTSAERGLKATGRAVFHDVSMSQGGDQLSAVRIDVDVAAVGSDGSRKLSRVQFSDWQYQLGLRPMLPVAPVAAAVEVVSPPATELQDSGLAPEAEKAQTEQPVAPAPFNWELAEFSAENGSISLGQADALIAEKLLLRAHHLSSGALSSFTLSGEFAGGDMRSQGKLQLQPAFSMTSKTYINSALPFAFNNWMQLSGMPRFVRGRVNAILNIAKRGPSAERAYSGKLKLGVYRGLMEAGAFPEDPMLQRTGYRAQGLLERLNAARKVSLSVPFQGAWDGDLITDILGEASLAALKKAGSKADIAVKQAEPPINKVTRLRLRGKRGFSYNERVRLRAMVKQLHADKTLIVELTPQLGTTPLDDEMIERVVLSQQRVERYMRSMGIGSKRIFPVWPQTIHQRGDAPGLLLQARPS